MEEAAGKTLGDNDHDVRKLGRWGWMMLMPLLWIALTGVIVWAVVKVALRPADQAAEQPRRETPQEILDRRFASGEIDADAYSQTRTRLAGRDVDSP